MPSASGKETRCGASPRTGPKSGEKAFPSPVARLESGLCRGNAARLASLHAGPRRERNGQVRRPRSEEHTSELQSPCNLVCRLLLEKKKTERHPHAHHLS